MFEGGAMPVMLTRLHVRYSADTFPEDLTFQETGDQENYQARYVLQHPWKGSPDACPAADNYFQQVREREIREAQTLADLTGWAAGRHHEKCRPDRGSIDAAMVEGALGLSVDAGVDRALCGG